MVFTRNVCISYMYLAKRCNRKYSLHVVQQTEHMLYAQPHNKFMISIAAVNAQFQYNSRIPPLQTGFILYTQGALRLPAGYYPITHEFYTLYSFTLYLYLYYLSLGVKCHCERANARIIDFSSIIICQTTTTQTSLEQ